MSTVRHRERQLWRLVAVAAFVMAGALFVTSGLNSGGLDLRASSVTDLDTVVRQERQRNDALQKDLAALNEEIAALTRSVDDAQVRAVQDQVSGMLGPAGFESVHGPALTVELTDAPKEAIDAAVKGGSLDRESLVVHQQDIQAVVNALWLGGAEAMTLQGQRVISTTGIKCIGNTVVLHGVPYAPPYRITAIGDVTALEASLDNDDFVAGYKTYVAAHDLGYRVTTSDDVIMPAYDGSRELRYAEAGSGAPTQR